MAINCYNAAFLTQNPGFTDDFFNAFLVAVQEMAIGMHSIEDQIKLIRYKQANPQSRFRFYTTIDVFFFDGEAPEWFISKLEEIYLK